MSRMWSQRRRFRSFVGIIAAAALALTVGVLSGPGAPAAVAVDEVTISPAVLRIVVVDTTVRAEPSHDADAVASLSAGDEISVSAQVPAWRKVTVEGVEGWVPYSVTQEVPRTFNRVPRELAADVTLRAQPGEKAAAGVTVLGHSYVTATAAAGPWRKIVAANGTGWAPASVLETVTAGNKAYAVTKALNVRASASGSTGVVTTLKKGTKVHVLGTRGAWSSVKWGDYASRPATTSGWTATKYLIDADIRVTKTAVNLRKTPWTGKVITVIPKGARVVHTGGIYANYSRTPTTWYSVRYGSLRGWVAIDYLKRPY